MKNLVLTQIKIKKSVSILTLKLYLCKKENQKQLEIL